VIAAGGQPSPESADAADEIHGGPQDDPARRPPPRVVAAVAAVAAVALVAGSGWLAVAHRQPRRSSAAPSPEWHAYGALQATPSPSLPLTPVGVRLGVRTGLRLPFSGTVPGWWDADSGRLTYIHPVPPPQANGYGFFALSRAGGFAALRPSQEPCDGCPGPPEPVELVSPTGLARLGPLGNEIAPGAAPDSVWITRYHLPAVPSRDPRQFAVTEQVDLRSRVLTSPVQLPPGVHVLRGVHAGLLLAYGQGKQEVIYVWDPVTGRSTILIPVQLEIAATAELMVWRDSCPAQQRCFLHVTNLVTGRQRDYTAPQANYNEGSISPDGRYLALDVLEDPDHTPGHQGNYLSTAVVVMDLATGRISPVPGSKIASNSNSDVSYYVPAWSADSNYLAIQTGLLPALWRVGSPRLWLLPALPVDNPVVTGY